jgi:hypothetical protein
MCSAGKQCELRPREQFYPQMVEQPDHVASQRLDCHLAVNVGGADMRPLQLGRGSLDGPGSGQVLEFDRYISQLVLADVVKSVWCQGVTPDSGTHWGMRR